MSKVNIALLNRKENSYEYNMRYIDMIEMFDANAIVIDERNLQNIENCQGILLPGGTKKHIIEDSLIYYALENDLSLLGICQGMQGMATYGSNEEIVSIGNSLHQNTYHNVKLYYSNLRNILNNNSIINVNSFHLETVNDPKVFKIVAKSSDGLIEAVENSNHPFQIGVQWHPELMLDYDSNQKRLVKTFISSCRK